MEFHKIPYVARALHDQTARNKFIDRFHGLSEANTVKAGALMQTMITCVNSLQSKLATLPLTNDAERAFYEDTQVFRAKRVLANTT